MENEQISPELLPDPGEPLTYFLDETQFSELIVRLSDLQLTLIQIYDLIMILGSIGISVFFLSWVYKALREFGR